MNEKVKPMLCLLTDKAFNLPGIIWEQKYDGARIIVKVKGRDVTLQSRSGRDKTGRFPELDIKTHSDGVFDGEILPLNETEGFAGVQSRINRILNIKAASEASPARLILWDALEVNGKDIRSLPLIERKHILTDTIESTRNVSLSTPYPDGASLFEQAKHLMWEGIIGKPINSPYIENDRHLWLKVKTWQSDIFFVCGWTVGEGKREKLFGALVLRDKQGNYVGKVGTGFDEDTMRALQVMFNPATCCWVKEPIKATWIQPFPVKIQYLEYTNDGILRFPSFKGLA